MRDRLELRKPEEEEDDDEEEEEEVEAERSLLLPALLPTGKGVEPGVTPPTLGVALGVGVNT